MTIEKKRRKIEDVIEYDDSDKRRLVLTKFDTVMTRALMNVLYSREY